MAYSWLKLVRNRIYVHYFTVILLAPEFINTKIQLTVVERGSMDLILPHVSFWLKKWIAKTAKLTSC